MKNEAMNLREWIDHYRWQGVDKIFLIENGSSDGGPAIIEREIATGFVELTVRPEPHMQTMHYRAVFEQSRIARRVEWLVMADLDEFWFSPNSTLRAAVEALTDIDLVYTNWTMFGSSGHIDHPVSVRRSFVHRQLELGAHSDTKWICRTDAIKDFRHIHLHKISGLDSARVVSDNETFRLNHYPIQSFEYFSKVKMTRWDASSRQFDSVRDLNYFRRYDESATVLDRTLADMVPIPSDSYRAGDNADSH